MCQPEYSTQTHILYAAARLLLCAALLRFADHTISPPALHVGARFISLSSSRGPTCRWATCTSHRHLAPTHQSTEHSPLFPPTSTYLFTQRPPPHLPRATLLAAIPLLPTPSPTLLLSLALFPLPLVESSATSHAALPHRATARSPSAVPSR